MKEGFRKTMTWLHTWSGLLLGWVCLAIFVTGTATYFRWEITRWMQPELRVSGTADEAVREGFERLQTLAPESPQWFVTVPDERLPAASLLWREPGAERRFGRAVVDAAPGEAKGLRESHGGEWFYRFHFQLHLPHPWGRYLAGLCALAMFVALITGVIAHRHLLADFFTLRSARSGLRGWLDVHNLAGVLALPYLLMITYSALVIFAALYMPWSRQVLGGETGGARGAARPTAQASTLNWIQPAPLQPMLDAVVLQWGASGRTIGRVDISERGTANCKVVFTEGQGDRVDNGGRQQLRFDGVTGKQLQTSGDLPLGPATTTNNYLYGLHLARFAGPALRWGFFLLGLMGSAVVATGLIMFTIRRRNPARRAPGLWLVERLNITFIAGLPLAIAGFFWANRLLPAALAGRADLEVVVFLCVWLLSLVHACCVRVTTGWTAQLTLTGALFLLLPALDALSCPTLLWRAIVSCDWIHLGFDLTVAVLGLVFLLAARRVRSLSGIHSRANFQHAHVNQSPVAAPSGSLAKGGAR